MVMRGNRQTATTEIPNRYQEKNIHRWVTEDWNWCPERLWYLRPWKYIKLNWTRFWTM